MSKALERLAEIAESNSMMNISNGVHIIRYKHKELGFGFQVNIHLYSIGKQIEMFHVDLQTAINISLYRVVNMLIQNGLDKNKRNAEDIKNNISYMHYLEGLIRDFNKPEIEEFIRKNIDYIK